MKKSRSIVIEAILVASAATAGQLMYDIWTGSKPLDDMMRIAATIFCLTFLVWIPLSAAARAFRKKEIAAVKQIFTEAKERSKSSEQ